MSWTYSDVLYALIDGQEYESEEELFSFLFAVRDWLRDPKACRQLAEEIQRYIDGQDDFCHNCGTRLQVRTWREARPYGSTVAYEEMGELYCPECEGGCTA